MSSITIELTPTQEKFLKLFAQNHHPGAVDNLATDIPIHVVQSREIEYIPADEQYAEDEPENIVFSSTVFSNGEKFKTPGDLVRAYYKDEECPVEIFKYEDVSGKEITGVDGEKRYIYSISKYFEAYNIDNYSIEYVHKSWRDIAFFFILSEAKRYMEYQKHNLHEPRTNSFSPGYSNEGEYRHFYELLRNIGNTLVSIETNES